MKKAVSELKLLFSMLDVLFLKDCHQILPDFLSLLAPVYLAPVYLVLVPVRVRESV